MTGHDAVSQAAPRLDADHVRQVRTELDRLLASAPFRNSRRCQLFLRHVVASTLGGEQSRLKERVIGIEVFDRDPAYDPGEDATVRVTANEVRKRLAQVYGSEPEDSHPLRIELPPGSYVPEFRRPVHPEPPAPTSSPAPPVRRLRWLAAAALAAVAVLAVWSLSRPGTPFEEFWAPMREGARPVLVCMTHPVVYLLREETALRFARENGIDTLAGPWVVDPAKQPITSPDIVPVPDMFVGAADAAASGRFLQLLSQFKRQAQLRIGNDISFTDLRSAPSIVIGAYSNRWTMQANQEYRFAFDHLKVVDRQNPGQEWRLRQVTRDYRSTEDYAIVSRVTRSHTGQFFLAAAGITQSGTQAAAEFLTEPKYLNQALARLARGWEQKNLQILLHTRVTGQTPGPPRVVAIHTW